MRTRVIIASNRLPVNITEEADGKLSVGRSIGGLATALGGIFQKYNAWWVGWTGLRRELSSKELRQLQLPARMLPVQAPEPIVQAYYDRVANSVLWPALHDLGSHLDLTDTDWQAFGEMAERFAAAIKKTVRPDDLIWIHDYHLLLVPMMLRRLGVDNRIGFFLHTTFPTAEHLLELPHNQEILANLCELDVLGLQTERDVARFWEGLQAAQTGKQPGLVRAFPIGIDYQSYRRRARRPAIRELAERVRQEHSGRKIILSISRLDYIKGIPNQLRIVERFLAIHPHPEEFVYKLVVAPSREVVEEYAQLREQIAGLVADINGRLGNEHWKPIEYAYQNFDADEMSTWLTLADVLLLTSHADGMNLIAKEYIASRQDDQGVLILSKTMGAAVQLNAALLTDPHDIDEGATQLGRAFDMPEAERAERWKQLRTVVRDEDVYWWADRFLDTLVDGA